MIEPGEVEIKLKHLERELARKRIVRYNTLWFERLKDIIREKMYLVTPDDYLKLAEMWKIDGNERKRKQTVNQVLRTMYMNKILDIVAPGTYMINPVILAYLNGDYSIEDVVKAITNGSA